MSGFLADLAERSAGRSRVVEPRRMPFEPRAEPLGEPPHAALEEPVTDAATPSVERAPAPPAPPRRRATPAARRARPPIAVQPLLTPERPSQEPEPVHVEARSRPAAAPTPEAPTAAEPAEAAEPPETPPQRLVATPEVKIETVTRLRETVRAAVPPVVHVTIGRVEVRAVHEPADPRPRRRPKPPPRMTLDEYLARGRP
jgi:hypothetical protein